MLQPGILSYDHAYEAVNLMTGLIGGSYFGFLFIFIGSYKLYALIVNDTVLRLRLFFMLWSLWLILAVGFSISQIMGNTNSGWIMTTIILLLSLSIVDGRRVKDG